jgi:hypothetical protein
MQPWNQSLAGLPSQDTPQKCALSLRQRLSPPPLVVKYLPDPEPESPDWPEVSACRGGYSALFDYPAERISNRLIEIRRFQVT